MRRVDKDHRHGSSRISSALMVAVVGVVIGLASSEVASQQLPSDETVPQVPEESVEEGIPVSIDDDVAAPDPEASIGQPDASDEKPGEAKPATPHDDFRIGVGDLLAVEVFGLPELTRDARVSGNGRVSLPMLGGVEVLGLTLPEAQSRIEEMLASRQLVVDPEVTISVKELVSRGVSIQGAVNRPGVFQLRKPTTLLEILVEAGGLSGDSGGQKIFVLRDSGNGDQARIEVDADRLIDQGDLTFNIFLQPGDIVVVPRPKTHRVFVSGAVRSPGPITFRSTEVMTVLQAISAAGGPTERANLGKVQVVRRLEEGGEERIVVDVKAIRRGRKEDFVLRESDTVVVREWFF